MILESRRARCGFCLRSDAGVGRSVGGRQGHDIQSAVALLYLLVFWATTEPRFTEFVLIHYVHLEYSL